MPLYEQELEGGADGEQEGREGRAPCGKRKGVKAIIFDEIEIYCASFCETGISRLALRFPRCACGRPPNMGEYNMHSLHQAAGPK